MVLYIAIRKNGDFGLMKRMERTAHRHRDVGAEVIMREGLEPVPVSEKGRVVDLVLPILVLIGFATWFLEEFSRAGVALTLAALLALVFAFAFLVLRRVIDYHQFAAAVLFGIKTMVPALVLLALAWGISTVCTELLGTGDYIASVLPAGTISLAYLPAILFLLGAVFAFATGASWGAIGILVPIGMTLCLKIDPSAANLTLAATLAGSVMGDHCSPISDTTILSSAGAQCKHMNHVMTQMPYAVLAGAGSLLIYLLAGMFWN